MSYYPLSRIITDQKANPGEFTLPDGREYMGDYYMTYDGKYFTGKNPLTKQNLPLTKVIKLYNPNSKYIPSKDNNIFNNLNKNNIDITELKEPIQFYPKPTEQDYKIGKITRYFAKQRILRIFKIIEIDKDTYNDIDNEGGIYNFPMWKVTSLFWQISGPLYDERPNGTIIRSGVINTNQRIVENKDKTFFGIKQYLTNYQQFYK